MLKLLLIVALLSGCKKSKSGFTTNEDPRGPEAHEKLLGPTTRCTYSKNDSVNYEVICIKDGKRMACIRGACATLSETPMEAK